MDLLRVITCGHVDDGKSTLLGRLLHDTKSIFEDQWDAVARASAARGDLAANLAFLTDGLRAEREQGITIDVAYRYFATPRRKFIVADCPGHFHFTRNMVTGASTAHAALLLVDVRHGLTEQTCRHAFLCTLLGVRHLIVCVNKMDLVDHQPAAFLRVREQFLAYAARLDGAEVHVIPLSALHGDNVVEPSPRLSWHAGPPLLDLLENLPGTESANHVDPRFPVQLVLPPSAGGPPLLAGRIASGVFRPGDEVVHLPAGAAARIVRIHGPAGPVAEAFPPMSVALELDRDLGAARGDLLARPGHAPAAATEFEIMLCWLEERPHAAGHALVLRHTTREVAVELSAVRHVLDPRTLRPRPPVAPLALNDLARVAVRCAAPVFPENYRRNRATGCVLLIDPMTQATVAAGLVLERGTTA
jgi:sulfate adenylyltransferase large subunit